jgi:cell volume regulation protein A
MQREYPVMISIEYILLIGASLIIISIGVARLSENLGVSCPVAFSSASGCLPVQKAGGIYFDDAYLAQSTAVYCPGLYPLRGRLDTRWSDVKPVVWQQ